MARLGALPLALVQAGRYMRETGTSCQKYLRLYNTSWSELQADVPRLRDYLNKIFRSRENLYIVKGGRGIGQYL